MRFYRIILRAYICEDYVVDVQNYKEILSGES